MRQLISLDQVTTETDLDAFATELAERIAAARADLSPSDKAGTLDPMESNTAIAKHPAPDGSPIHSTGSGQDAHAGGGSKVLDFGEVKSRYEAQDKLPEGERKIWVHAKGVDNFEKKVARLNSRARRYFPDQDPFTVERSGRTAKATETYYDVEGGITFEGEVPAGARVKRQRAHTWYEYDIKGEPPVVPGYEFVGTIEHIQEEGGDYTNILKKVPGVEADLSKYRDAGPNCDLCKRNIYRRDTFLVRNTETGEIKQLGRDDLQNYTGATNAEDMAKYAAMWTEFQSAARDDDFMGDSGGGEWGINHETYLTHAAMIIRQDGRYRKTSEHPNTKNTVSALFTKGGPARLKEMGYDIEPTDQDVKKAKDVMAWLDEMDPEAIESDYIWNLYAAARHPSGVLDKNAGLMASAIAAYDREQGLIVQRETRANNDALSEWVGEIKERRDFDLTITRENSFEGSYGTTYVYEMVDNDANQFVWFASNPISQEVPDTAAIAEHQNFIAEGKKIFEEKVLPAGGSLKGAVGVMGHTTGDPMLELKQSLDIPEAELEATRRIFRQGPNAVMPEYRGEAILDSYERNALEAYVRAEMLPDYHGPRNRAPVKTLFAEVGDQVKLKATIKDHKLDTYKGRERKQTVITRGKLLDYKPKDMVEDVAKHDGPGRHSGTKTPQTIHKPGSGPVAENAGPKVDRYDGGAWRAKTDQGYKYGPDESSLNEFLSSYSPAPAPAASGGGEFDYISLEGQAPDWLGSHIATLSPEQKSVLGQYGGSESNLSDELNASLRSGQGHELAEMVESAMVKVPEGTTLYRGMSTRHLSPEVAALLEGGQIGEVRSLEGEVIGDPGFMSATFNEGHAAGFSVGEGEAGVLLEMEAGGAMAAPADWVTGRDYQEELILAPGTQLQLHDAELSAPFGDPMWRVRGSVVAADPTAGIDRTQVTAEMALDQTDILDANAAALAEVAVNPRPGIDDNPAIVASATQLFSQALDNEADISPVLQKVAEETGGELAGYEWRVKLEDSIRDKLFRDMAAEVAAENNPTWEQVASQVHDLNRYTLTWPADENWVPNQQAAVDALAADGWEIYDHKDKNGWATGDHYNGMNYQFKKGDQYMEVQFHTPESYFIKEESHKIFKEVRILPPEDPYRQNGIAQIWDLWNGDTSHVPPGVESIGTPVTFLMKAQVVANPAYIFYFRTDDKGAPSILYRTDGNTCEAFGNRTGQWHPVPLTLAELAGLGGSSDYWPTTDRKAMDFIMEKAGAKKDIRAAKRPVKVKKHGDGSHDEKDHGNRGPENWTNEGTKRNPRFVRTVGGKAARLSYGQGDWIWEWGGEQGRSQSFAQAEEAVLSRSRSTVQKRILKADFSPTIRIVETDEPQNLIFGWANVSFTKDGEQVLDHQGHMIDIEDLEHMAYNFTVKYRKSGDMHKSAAFGELVESMVYTPEKLEVLGLPEGSVPYAWWVGFRLPPEEAEKVRKGERSMLSIEGGARLELVDE